MRRQTILADGNARRLKTRLHHPPAKRAWCRTEQKNYREPHGQRPDDSALTPKHQKRHKEYDTERASQKPMRPLPPIDRLEPGESKSAIDQIILRRALVFGEFRLPGRVRQRWNSPGYWLPLRDGKSGSREADKSTHHHH